MERRAAHVALQKLANNMLLVQKYHLQMEHFTLDNDSSPGPNLVKGPHLSMSCVLYDCHFLLTARQWEKDLIRLALSIDFNHNSTQRLQTVCGQRVHFSLQLEPSVITVALVYQNTETHSVESCERMVDLLVGQARKNLRSLANDLGTVIGIEPGGPANR